MQATILLFGGTALARKLSSALCRKGIPHFYSTKTPSATEHSTLCKTQTGAMDAAKIARFCKEKSIRLILDSSHPFAENLHEEIACASEWLNTPVLRLEREQTERIHHPLVHYIPQFSEACTAIQSYGCKNILATTGVNSYPKLKLFVTLDINVRYRILDRQASLASAAAFGIPARQLLPAPPPICAADEVFLIRKYRFDALISKETGTDGGLNFKISACLAEKIPIFIIGKPKVPESFSIATSIEEILHRLK